MQGNMWEALEAAKRLEARRLNVLGKPKPLLYK